MLEPIEALLPSRGVEKIYFFELENWNQIHVFNNKYVKITGNFTKISPPIFLGIPVLKVTSILADDWLNNADFESEEMENFSDKLIVNMSVVACKIARFNQLASGHKILEVEGDYIIELGPDGSKKIIKKLPCSSFIPKFENAHPEAECLSEQ